ncbi:hypothetical protein SODALDRAFT_349145 [Sodiomyces alkalinus F11]|uniref:BPL/LPL catalytic domain-containing protein n=1 Tax=Sodiomyces alkalinus (strain CBS 110278 / VKM F-3762 / F11) TaxID=1314773 RepID=A0A3N2Q2T3_SODAK|nr:hypothetical protein SODALDRAFT_349145 [Sodiomyces alkalinus F11]ROT41060.1 hypothetical protein SODALDRAFT_349145 [Sodiomyces alkalinus F11]
MRALPHRLHPRHLNLARRCFSNCTRVVDLIQHDASPAVFLNHIHLSSSQDPFPPYAVASEIQSQIRQIFLSYKAAATTSPTTSAPSPVLLSFTPSPTYTLGRRQTPISPTQASRLRQPLRVPLPNTMGTDPSAPAEEPGTKDYIPLVLETDRGGLTTYHGPGQIVLWPILDLRSPLHTNFRVRCYARLLEQTTRALLLAHPHLGIQTHLSEADPGVWVRRGSEQHARDKENGNPAAGVDATDATAAPTPADLTTDRKIAALGVHLRRHVTGLGTALNLDVATRGPDSVNPWARFVPCGLDGKGVASVRDLIAPGRWAAAVAAAASPAAATTTTTTTTAAAAPSGIAAAFAEDMARRWAAELSSRIGLDGRVRSTTVDVESIITTAAS